MQYKNLIFFMLLNELRRLAAGIAAIAVLAGVAAHAGTADGITAGKSLAMERNKGNCLACHRIEDGELPGTIGPDSKSGLADAAFLQARNIDGRRSRTDCRLPVHAIA
jgi:sulfur-oxidizing protein SoxX